MSIGFPTAGDTTRELRWMSTPNAFPKRGAVLATGEIEWPDWLDSLRIDARSSLVLTAQAGVEWEEVANQLWALMPRILAELPNWIVVNDAKIGDFCEADQRLCATVTDVLNGEFGQFVAGHGGQIDVLEIRDGVVRVRLAGACSGCALADVTVKLRLERDIRNAAGADFAELIAER